MYSEIILDRYRYPHNYGKLTSPDIVVKELNPLCGDAIEFYIKLNGEHISEIKFSGSGCAISQASTDILTDSVKGKSLDDIKKLDRDFVLELLGIEISPVRLKCALLPLVALKVAVSK